MTRRTSRNAATVAWIATALLASAATSTLAADVAAYFSPSVNTLELITTKLDTATTSIDLAMFYFSNPACRAAIVHAKERGLTIRVILDKSQRVQASAGFQWLRHHNIDARIDSHEKIFHDKFCVIDGTTTIIGSTNWTDSGFLHNAEALVVITDATIATDFTANFNIHWAHTEQPAAAAPPPAAAPSPRVTSHHRHHAHKKRKP